MPEITSTTDVIKPESFDAIWPRNARGDNCPKWCFGHEYANDEDAGLDYVIHVGYLKSEGVGPLLEKWEPLNSYGNGVVDSHGHDIFDDLIQGYKIRPLGTVGSILQCSTTEARAMAMRLLELAHDAELAIMMDHYRNSRVVDPYVARAQDQVDEIEARILAEAEVQS